MNDADDETRAGWLAQCLGNSAHSPLGQEDLTDLLDAAEVSNASAGSVVFSRSDPVDHVFILETGKVALTRPGLDRTPVLQILHPGDIFGDLPVLLGQRAGVEAVILEDAQYLTIEGDRLILLVSTRPRIALRWMVSIARRLNAAQDRLEELLAGPLDFQLATLLRHTADGAETVRLNQETLSRLLGARRPSIARSLANLEKQGLIRKEYGQVRIINPAGLAALTG